MPPVKNTTFTKGGSLSEKKPKAPRAARGGDLQVSPPPPLTAFQLESVALFIHVFGALSLPRSIGEIYGLLFSTQEPLSLDDVQMRLQLSRGSASEGLRWLRSLGAVNQVYLAGSAKSISPPRPACASSPAATSATASTPTSKMARTASAASSRVSTPPHPPPISKNPALARLLAGINSSPKPFPSSKPSPANSESPFPSATTTL